MARIARMTAGFALTTAGSVMLFLPGPGIVTIIAGLAILSEDVAWARRLSEKMRSRIDPKGGRQKAQAGG